jgi:hypothetical protein
MKGNHNDSNDKKTLKYLHGKETFFTFVTYLKITEQNTVLIIKRK